MNSGECNSTSNSCKVHFSKFFISLLKYFIVLSYQIKSKFFTLVLKLSHNPVIMYHCSSITLHAPYFSTLQSNCITLGFQTPHTFLPPSPCSRGSFCLEYPLPPPQWPISDGLSSHYALLVLLRHVSSTGLCFGTLLAVKDYDRCTTITLCSLLLVCILLKRQCLPILVHLSVLFLFQLISKWLLVHFMDR